MSKKTSLTINDEPPLGLRPGVRIEWWPRPTWYVRLWGWIRRKVLRRPDPPPPAPMVITDIDYERRVVTYGRSAAS